MTGMAWIHNYVADMIHAAGLENRYRAQVTSPHSSLVGTIAYDGFDVQLTYMTQAPTSLGAWFELDTPAPAVWGGLYWGAIPYLGRRAKEAARAEAIGAGAAMLKSLPRSIDDLARMAESALREDGISIFEYGDAVVLCLAGRALSGLDVNHEWANSLIDSIVKTNETLGVNAWGHEHNLGSLRMSVAAEIYQALAQVRVAMGQDVKGKPLARMLWRKGATSGEDASLSQVRLDLRPNLNLDIHRTDSQLEVSLIQSAFDWGALPFSKPVSIRVHLTEDQSLGSLIERFADRAAFYELARRDIQRALRTQTQEPTAWNWSVMCAAIDGVRRGQLSFGQQVTICQSLDVGELTPWPAITAAVHSVAAALRESAPR